MSATTKDKLVSIKSIASRLDLSVRAVYRLIANGDIPPPVKVGGASRFYESDIDTYLERLKGSRLD